MKIKEILILSLILTTNIPATQKRSLNKNYFTPNKKIRTQSDYMFNVIKDYILSTPYIPEYAYMIISKEHIVNHNHKHKLEKELRKNNFPKSKSIININFDKDENAPLHRAIKDNNTEAVKVLLSLGSVLNMRNTYGWAPIHLALYQDNLEIVELLLSKGANPNNTVPHFYNPRNGIIIADNGEISSSTPLHSAALNNHLDIASLLIKYKANINFKNQDGNTPLHLAITNNHYSMAEYLINNKAKVNTKNINNITPLITAWNNNKLNLVRLLIKAGANINQLDQSNILILLRLFGILSLNTITTQDMTLDSNQNNQTTNLLKTSTLRIKRDQL